MHNVGMTYGHARASIVAQDDLASQLAQLEAAGCENVFREKITGTTADRPQLKKLIAALAHGDVVIITAVDRLFHDTTDPLVIARDMPRAAGTTSVNPVRGARKSSKERSFGPRDYAHLARSP